MILTIGTSGSGLTFLNWTIVFLRGDTTYTNLDNKCLLVNTDPLQGPTAHGFSKDHIQSSNNLPLLKNGTKKSVVYVTPTHQDDFDYVATINCKKIVFSCQSRSKDLVARMATLVPNDPVLDLLDYLRTKFGQAQAKHGLLECSKFITNYYKIPTPSNEYFIINYEDVFENLDARIHDIFLFLEEKIDLTRLAIWQKIYDVYRERNSTVLTSFSPQGVDIDTKVNPQILKEIFRWKNGLCPRK